MITNDRLEKSLKFMHEHVEDEELNLIMIAEDAGYSTEYYSRIFKKSYGISVMRYLRRIRLLYALTEVRSGNSILDTAYKYGYSKNGFTKACKDEYYVTPEEIKRRS